MKIVHIITRLILGGAQENTILTCEGLAELGHDVTLLTGPAIGPEGELLSRARAGPYRTEVLDDLRREIHPLRDWRSLRAIRRRLGELAPDVVHTHSSKAGILGRQAAAGGGARVVHTIHGLAFHPFQRRAKNGLYIALERRAAGQCDAIVSVADAMTRQALAAGVGSADQYSTVYSGMEVARFVHRPDETDTFRDSLDLPDNAILVTQVSRLAELKGHEYIIDAARRISDERVIFCFVGDGHLRSQLEAEIGRAGLAGRFRLTGLLAPRQIPAVMHATDILVHCSLREGLARTLPQAMLAARPVISWDVDGAGEVVNDGTGLLLDRGDVAGLTAGIEALAADPARRDALGQAGLELCRHRFDHRVMVRQLDELYRRLLG